MRAIYTTLPFVEHHLAHMRRGSAAEMARRIEQIANARRQLATKHQLHVRLRSASHAS